MSARAFVVVLDACGAGALPDAVDYGDAGTNTLAHVAETVGGLALPALERLGLGRITPIAGVAAAATPALHGRLAPLGPGKDSATGHWELMGAVPSAPLPTYPDGFPPDVVATLERVTGRGFCLNAPSDGLGAIEGYGEHHLESGELILYTSVDSVLQVAAHEDVMGEEELHAVCAAIRDAMTGEHAVGRVIARPFGGRPGAFERTPGRKDFALAPPGPTYMEALGAAGVPVHAVGKVHDLFAGRGIDVAHPAASNAEGLDQLDRLVDELAAGLAFANLVDTDQVHGHRKDVAGFARALEQIDAAVATWLERLGPRDLLVITADHGCDPLAAHSDHTREYAPMLAVFAAHGGRRRDGALADVGASVLRWLTGGDEPALPGTPWL